MSESSVIKHKLAVERPGRLIWEYSLPAIVGTVVMALYNIVDRIFIGHGVGALAISGLALTFPFMNILTAFGMLVGSGSAARISITLGANDKEKAERILANAFILSFIVSGFAILLSYIFMSDLLRLFGGTESTVKYAEEYMQIIIPGAILSALNYGFNHILRASGYPKKAMFTMIICAVANVVFDALFIFVFGWGVKGAAHATNLSFLIGCIWVLPHFFRSQSTIKFKKKYFNLNWTIIRSIISIGLSPFSMQVAMSFVVVLINFQLIHHGGDLAIGAYGIINSLSALIIMVIIGLNQGVQPIIGFNYGANLHDRMFKVLRIAVTIGTIVSITGFLLSQFIPEFMVKLFTSDEQLINIASNGLRISLLAFPIVGFQIVISNFFQSIGKASISIFLSLTRQFIFLIPCLFLLPNFYDLDGVWASQPFADSLATIVALITLILFLRKFKKN